MTPKRIKIFSFPVHQLEKRTHGVDFARIIQPMSHLNGYEEFETYIWHPKDMPLLNWPKICQKYDAIYCNYFPVIEKFVPMAATAKHFGIPIIMDVDDSLWDIQKDNPAYDAFKPGSEGIANFSVFCDLVDYVTTTSSYLKNAIASHTHTGFNKIKVFPNYIDLKLYNHVPPFKDDGKIVLLHHGSTTHFLDLREQEFVLGIDKIMKEYPNVVFKTVGASIPKFKEMWGNRYINAFGDEDFYKWAKEVMPPYMEEADIMVTPLKVNAYTRAKSAIKYLENGSYSKPGVYQRIRQYSEVIENGIDGFLCESSREWYESIKKLICDKQLRKTMGKNAYNKVKSKYQIKDHIIEYATFLRDVLK